jgi:hypothetical protein
MAFRVQAVGGVYRQVVAEKSGDGVDISPRSG